MPVRIHDDGGCSLTRGTEKRAATSNLPIQGCVRVRARTRYSPGFGFATSSNGSDVRRCLEQELRSVRGNPMVLGADHGLAAC
jgi:hypothetical protein